LFMGWVVYLFMCLSFEMMDSINLKCDDGHTIVAQ
jgi:hypothetical protein